MRWDDVYLVEALNSVAKRCISSTGPLPGALLGQWLFTGICIDVLNVQNYYYYYYY